MATFSMKQPEFILCFEIILNCFEIVKRNFFQPKDIRYYPNRVMKTLTYELLTKESIMGYEYNEKRLLMTADDTLFGAYSREILNACSKNKKTLSNWYKL